VIEHESMLVKPTALGKVRGLYGIEVREHGAVTVVELRGELDLFTLSDLRDTLSRVLVSMRPTLLDLSGITFLDLASARELAVRCRLYLPQPPHPARSVT